MKIVLIDKEEGLKVGGIAVFTNRLSNYLRTHGHQTYILRFANNRKRVKNTYHIPYYIAESRTFILLPSEKTLDIIKSHLTRLRPDIVYMNIGISPLDYFIPSLCHDLRIPIAGIWHGDLNGGNDPIQVLLKSIFLAYLPFVKQLDLLHVFSQKFKDFYISKGMPEDRILVLPNGVNKDFFKPGPSNFAKKFKIINGVLFMGRLTLVKNPETLIKSFLYLNPPGNHKLVLMGSGDLEDELKEKYRDDRIIFTGAVYEEKRKLDIIRSCRIFVLPSRYEGMSLSLLEAMSCGLAPLATGVGSDEEVVKNAGIILDSTKIDNQLLASLRLCFENPDIVQLLGQKARRKIILSYSQEKIFKTLVIKLEETALEYKKRKHFEPPQFQLDKRILRKLAGVWRKAKELGSYI